MSSRRRAFQSRSVELDGITLHLRVSRTGAGGRPVVLIHGLAGSSGAMMRAARLLAPVHRVVAVDLPGHGRSPCLAEGCAVADLGQAVSGWLTQSGLDDVALVAASFGCQVAVDVALRTPDLVERLVLLGPVVDPVARGFVGFTGRLALDVLLEPRMISPVARGIWQTGPRRLVETIRAMADDPLDERLADVRQPTLVVRGRRDVLLPHAAAERAVALLPHGRLLEIRGVAHSPNHTHPRRFVRLIEPFLAGAPLPEPAISQAAAT